MKRTKELRFSKHALDKIKERTSLTWQEVASIINNNRCIKIGIEKKKHHKLFYSPNDEKYFVIIHDEDDNLVVTFLPDQFHHRWQISEEVLLTARNMMVNNPQLSNEIDQSEPSSGERSFKVTFTCYFRNPVTDKIKIVNFSQGVLAVNLSDYLARLHGSEYIQTKIAQEIWETNRLESVFYRIGRDEKRFEYRI